MFSHKPYTLETGEDMHLCFSAKLSANIPSLVGEQVKKEDECDITNNALGGDAHSSYLISERDGHKLRREVQEYWVKKDLNLYNILR